MRKVKILCDSVCDITNFDDKEGTKTFDFDFLPLYVRFNSDIYKDYKEIKPAELFKKVEELKMLPQTTCPSPDDYYQFFKKYVDKDYDIVFLSIGSSMSGGYKSACLAREELEDPNRVFVFDSSNISTGIGILALKAFKLRDEGKSAKQIYDYLVYSVNNSKCKFVVDTMEYLYKGGRCSALKALIGSVLRIKPVITVKDGKLQMYKNALGKQRAFIELINAFKEDLDNGNIDMDYIMVTHCENKTDFAVLKNKLIGLGIDEKCIHESTANCTVATHCGPNCIGIIYLTKYQLTK